MGLKEQKERPSMRTHRTHPVGVVRHLLHLFSCTCQEACFCSSGGAVVVLVPVDGQAFVSCHRSAGFATRLLVAFARCGIVACVCGKEAVHQNRE